MKKLLFVAISCAAWIVCLSQSANINLLAARDSTLRAIIHADSVKTEKQFEQKARWAKLISEEKFPAVNAGAHSGVFPVKNITEIPDPSMQYKLLFEIHDENPDSALNEFDYNLVEVSRIINLHVASGIPLKNISVVVVAHGPVLNSLSTNQSYQKRFKMDNPNLELIKNLEKLGVRFVVCGQAMDFGNFTKEDMLPEMKISLTAQTALTGYQLKGYVLKTIKDDREK
ncbi:MAG: DsrE family protein [Ginsengibacter sp.]